MRRVQIQLELFIPQIEVFAVLAELSLVLKS